MSNSNVTSSARSTIMDACQSISRSADALKSCHTVDGDWGDDLDAKAFYEAELRLLERLTGLLDRSGRQQLSASVQVPCPVCGGEAIGHIDMLERVTIAPPSRAEVTYEQPSLTNSLTPYGMLVRALRIVAQTSLYDMGQALLLSPAKLSAMEFGRAPVTPEIVREVGTYFESLGIHNMRPALQFAIDAARTGNQS
ncbi:hypothetical protein H0X90_21565 [Burkholderia sp. 9775_39]|uniref:hypothetical protein n=1 Tax=unclassified Burkholderia TaxID=2613784 RepID=UPI0018C42343|nr:MULTISPECIES: hypothetical protein [unclassified Burkholderia]MBG0879381.1 hypothetical protein [Burkholderia sp. 9775_39]MBG0884522.1 hypothetical protein [Burkholderia sp. 9773_38]